MEVKILYYEYDGLEFKLLYLSKTIHRNFMKRIFSAIYYIFTSILLLNTFRCASNSAVITVKPGNATTEECITMEEICSEANTFRKYFDTLPEEQQKDMIPVLNTYQKHCADAQEACRKSQNRR